MSSTREIDDSIKRAFDKAAVLLRKKAKSFSSWSSDPSAAGDTSAAAVREAVSDALCEVASALEFAFEEPE